MELLDKILHSLGLSATALLLVSQEEPLPRWLRIVAIVVVGGSGMVSQSLVRKPKVPPAA